MYGWFDYILLVMGFFVGFGGFSVIVVFCLLDYICKVICYMIFFCCILNMFLNNYFFFFLNYCVEGF